MKITKRNLFFYIAAVVFLFFAVFRMIDTYQYIDYMKESTEVMTSDIISTYIGNVTPSFAYAIICYGIGVILEHLHTLNTILHDGMQDALNEKEEQAK